MSNDLEFVPPWAPIGIGPWPDEELPTEEHYDQELLVNGDSRNVIDRFRYWRMEAIVEVLDQERFPFEVAVENWQHDLNIGSIVRSANGFGAKTVHIVGLRRWNKRGAMVTDRYQHLQYHDNIPAFSEWVKAEQMRVIAVDNMAGSVPIETFNWPKRCVLLFGQEGPGLSDQAAKLAETMVAIAQFGSTRSLNASAAAAVAMHSWILQHGQR